MEALGKQMEEAGSQGDQSMKWLRQVKVVIQVVIQPDWVDFGGSNLLVIIDMLWEREGETGIKKYSLSLDLRIMWVECHLLR